MFGNYRISTVLNVFLAAFIIISPLSLDQFAYANNPISITVPDKMILLSHNEWIKLKDETSFVINLEERKQRPWHKYGRIVSIYLIPMSEDRKQGLRISENEYIEFFIVHPGFVTMQTRIDKGRYWVLCRETLLPKTSLPIDISKYKPWLDINVQLELWQHYQAEIDETRHLLHSKF